MSARLATLVGVAGAAALSRGMTSLLFEVSPYDALSYVTVAIGLMSAACLASWLPTRRALRVDPAAALRTE